MGHWRVVTELQAWWCVPPPAWLHPPAPAPWCSACPNWGRWRSIFWATACSGVPWTKCSLPSGSGIRIPTANMSCGRHSAQGGDPCPRDSCWANRLFLPILLTRCMPWKILLWTHRTRAWPPSPEHQPHPAGGGGGTMWWLWTDYRAGLTSTGKAGSPLASLAFPELFRNLVSPGSEAMWPRRRILNTSWPSCKVRLLPKALLRQPRKPRRQRTALAAQRPRTSPARQPQRRSSSNSLRRQLAPVRQHVKPLGCTPSTLLLKVNFQP